VNTEECGFQQGKDLCQVKNKFLFIVKQVEIINDIFLESILSMVTSDDPYAYVVAKTLHLSLPFCSLPSLFLSTLPAHDKGTLLDEMRDGSSIPCAGILCVYLPVLFLKSAYCPCPVHMPILYGLNGIRVETGLNSYRIKYYIDPSTGTADGGTVVKVLHYKSEGRWFDSRWCHWNFSLT
jgi:hypothetical protein